MKHSIRPVPLASAFFVLGAATMLVANTDAAWWVIPTGVIGPDLVFLAAIGAPAAQRTSMPARVVGPYNLLHHPGGPIAATAMSAALTSPTALALSLTWGSHVLWDRGVGYGLIATRAAPAAVIGAAT